MKMKSIIKKSSLILCISINLLILINIVQSNSSIKDLRYNDSGQCELNGLIVEPGERLNHPDECIQVVCFRDGSGRGKVNYCPWDPAAVYLDTTLPYPKCCKVKESKSYKQFRTYYRQPSGESSRVNKQLQNQVENNEQEPTRNNDYDEEKPVRKPVFKTTAKPQFISRPTISSVELDENKSFVKSEKPYTSIQRTRRPAFTRPSKPSVYETEDEEELNENEPEIQQFSASTRVPTTIRRRTTVKRIEISTTEKVPEVTEAEDDSEDEEIPSEITTTTPAPITTTTEAAKVEASTEKSEEKQEVEINNDDEDKEKEEENKVPLRRINLRKPISETSEAVKNEDEEEKKEEEKVKIKDDNENKAEVNQNVKPTLRPINFGRPRPTPTEAVQVTTEDSKNDEQKVEINDDAENKEEVNQNVKPTFRPINFRRPRPTPTEAVKVTTEDSKNDEEKVEINDDAENKEEVNQNVKPTLRPINFRRPRPTPTEAIKVTTEDSKHDEQEAEINSDAENKEEVNQNVKPTLRPIKYKRPSRPTTMETADVETTTEINDIAENKDEEEETIKTTLKPISARRPRPFQRNINTIKGTTPASVETEENDSTPSSIGRPRPSRAQVSRNVRLKITTGGNEIDNDENYPSWYKNKNPTRPTLSTDESTEISNTEGPVVEIGGKTDRKIPLRFRLKTTEEGEEESSTETNFSEHRENLSSQKNFEFVSDETFGLSKELTDEENSTGVIKSEIESEQKVSSETSMPEKSGSEDVNSQDALSTVEQQNESTAFISDEKLEFITSTESVVSIENETERAEESINSDENKQLKLDSESKSAETSSDKINSNFHTKDIFIHVKVVTEPNHINSNSTLSPSVNELESESIANANEKLSKREDTQKQIQVNDDVFQKSNDDLVLNLEQQKGIPVFNNAEINDFQQKIIKHTIEDYNNSQQKVLVSFFDLKDLNNIIEKDSSIIEGHRLSETKESENLNKNLSFVSTQENSQTNVAFNNENTQQKIDESISDLTASTNHVNSEQSTLNQETSIDGLNQKSETDQNSNQLLQGSENFSEKQNTEQDINDVQHSVGVIESQQHLINSDSAIHSNTENLIKDNESSQQHTTNHQSSENKHKTTESIDVNNNSAHNERQQKLLETDNAQEAENSQQKLSTSAELEKKSVEDSSIIENDSNQDSIETQQHLLNVDAELKEVLKESLAEGTGSSQQQNIGGLTVLTSSDDINKEKTESEKTLKEGSSPHFNSNQQIIEGSLQQTTANLKDSNAYDSANTQTSNTEKDLNEGSSVEIKNSQESVESQQQLLGADAELRDLQDKLNTQTEQSAKETESSQQQIAVNSNDLTSSDSVQTQSGKNERELKETKNVLTEGSPIQVNHNQEIIEGSQQQSAADLKVLGAIDSTHTQTSSSEKALTEGSSEEIKNSQESVESQQHLMGADAELRDLQNKLSTQTEQNDKETKSSQQQIAVNSNDLTSSDSLQTQSGKNEKELSETKNVLTEGSSFQVNNNQEFIEGSQQQSAADLKVLDEIDSTLSQNIKPENILTQGSSVDVQDSTLSDSIQTQNDKNEKVLTESSSAGASNNQELIKEQQSATNGFSQTSETENVSTEASSIHINNSGEDIETQQHLLGADAELKDLLNEISSKTDNKVRQTENSQHQIAVDLKDSTSTDSSQTHSGKNEKVLTEGSFVQNQGFVEQQHDSSHPSNTGNGLTGTSSVQINNNEDSIETQQQLLGADAELKDVLNQIRTKTEENFKQIENVQHQNALDLKDSTSTHSIQTHSGKNQEISTEDSSNQINKNQELIEQQQNSSDGSSHTSETGNGLTEASSVQIDNNKESIETQQKLLESDAKSSLKSENNVKEAENSQHQIAVDLNESTSSDSIQTQNNKDENVLTEGASIQVNHNQGSIEGLQQQTEANDLSHTQTSETGKDFSEGSFVHINKNDESVDTQQHLLGAEAELKDLLKEIGGKSSSESHSFQQQQQQQTTVHSNGLAQLNNNHKDIETQQRTLSEDAELRLLLIDLKDTTSFTQISETHMSELPEIHTEKTDEFQQRSLRNNKEEGIEPIYFRAPGRYRIVPGELIPVQLYLD